MIVIFTFLCVMVVTAVLFGGWVIVTIAQLIGRAVSGFHRPYFDSSSTRGCGNTGCRTINPMHANYCRRCGSSLLESSSAPRPVAQRRPRYNPTNGTGRQMVNA